MQATSRGLRLFHYIALAFGAAFLIRVAISLSLRIFASRASSDWTWAWAFEILAIGAVLALSGGARKTLLRISAWTWVALLPVGGVMELCGLHVFTPMDQLSLVEANYWGLKAIAPSRQPSQSQTAREIQSPGQSRGGLRSGELHFAQCPRLTRARESLKEKERLPHAEFLTWQYGFSHGYSIDEHCIDRPGGRVALALTVGGVAVAESLIRSLFLFLPSSLLVSLLLFRRSGYPPKHPNPASS